MATDATGTPTSLGIPKYNTATDPPSGKGFNAAMDALDALLVARVAKNTWTTTGDILYASAPNTPARLGIGATGTVLTVAGGVPTWAAVSSMRGVFAARRTTDQLIGNASTVKIQVNTEDYDQDGWYDPTTNYRYTPLVAGYYRLTGSINFFDSWNAGTTAALLLYKNGSLHRTLWKVTDGMNILDGGSVFEGSAIVQANGSSDYFELFCQNGEAASNRNVQARFEGNILIAT